MEKDFKIVVSGDKWLQFGAITTSRAINELIEECERSLILTIYIINNKDILDQIERALIRNIKIDIYMYELDKRFEWATFKINKLNEIFSNLNVYISSVEFIHAKVLIADGHLTLIGSANLTKQGLSTNYELGILLDNEEIAYKVKKIIRNLKK